MRISYYHISVSDDKNLEMKLYDSYSQTRKILSTYFRAHAVPNTVFNHEDLGYVYDNLNIGSYNVDQLEELIHHRQSKPRVWAGFLLKGIKTSGSVVLNICKVSGCIIIRISCLFPTN